VIDLDNYFSDQLGNTLTYSVKGLPPGLSLNAATGVISGTATAGTFDVLITATDKSFHNVALSQPLYLNDYQFTVAPPQQQFLFTNTSSTINNFYAMPAAQHSDGLQEQTDAVVQSNFFGSLPISLGLSLLNPHPFLTEGSFTSPTATEFLVADSTNHLYAIPFTPGSTGLGTISSVTVASDLFGTLPSGPPGGYTFEAEGSFTSPTATELLLQDTSNNFYTIHFNQTPHGLDLTAIPYGSLPSGYTFLTEGSFTSPGATEFLVSHPGTNPSITNLYAIPFQEGTFGLGIVNSTSAQSELFGSLPAGFTFLAEGSFTSPTATELLVSHADPKPGITDYYAIPFDQSTFSPGHGGGLGIVSSSVPASELLGTMPSGYTFLTDGEFNPSVLNGIDNTDQVLATGGTTVYGNGGGDLFISNGGSNTFVFDALNTKGVGFNVILSFNPASDSINITDLGNGPIGNNPTPTMMNRLDNALTATHDEAGNLELIFNTNTHQTTGGSIVLVGVPYTNYVSGPTGTTIIDHLISLNHPILAGHS